MRTAIDNIVELKLMAEWYDNPKNPCGLVNLNQVRKDSLGKLTPGYLLRMIADAQLENLDEDATASSTGGADPNTGDRPYSHS